MFVLCMYMCCQVWVFWWTN